MAKTLFEVNKELETNYTFDDYPIGQRVRLRTVCEDFTFFEGNETGKVIKNTGKYLGITVQFDKQLHYRDGSTLDSFNFNPTSLEPINNKEKEMRYEIVDKMQTFKDVVDGKIDEADIEVVNFGQGEVWGVPEINIGDLKDDKIIFIRKYYE
jgi:hypothetical protein